jgi:C-1 hydroxylase
MTEQDRMAVRRFYHELWNGRKLELADEIVAEDLVFRGSLGASIRGRDGLKTYVHAIRTAFPDWHNEIDEMIAVDDCVVTGMT